ncbi:MAG: hypothetical protein QM736_15690 [Vicinamibacterales bacterium]
MNPESSNCTAYAPGVTPVNAYPPSLADTVDRTRPVAVSVAVTDTPGTTASA